MKILLRAAAALLLTLAACGAQAQSCSPISGSATVTVTDLFSGTNYDVQGTVTFSCTRPSGNPRFPAVFWIGASGANGSRNLANGGNTLAYSLFTNFSGCSTAWSGTTGVTVNNSLTANGDVTLTNVSGTFCMRIATSGQNTARPLTFTASETLTIKSTSSTGFQWGTGTLSLTGTVNALCKFPSAGTTTLAMAYTSFQPSTTDATTTMNVQCTNTTSYSLSLDATSGTVPGVSLDYTIGLGNPGAQPGVQTLSSLSGSGNSVGYTVYGRVLANQSGTCATGSGCTNSDSRTVTIAY